MLVGNRRRFLSLSLGAGASLGFGLATWYRTKAVVGETTDGSDASSSAEKLHEASKTSRAMGSDVAITVLHESREVAGRAVAAAMDELTLVEELLSLYRPGSQLCRLNRWGALCDPHPCLVEVFRAAETTSRQTEGAFDVTVQPLWSLYVAAKATGALPDDATIESARQKVDWRRVDVSAQCIRLSGEGTAVTLNGVAQGFAADRVMAVLRQHGVRHAMVNTGEIGTLGRKADGQPWKVGIQHPRRQDAYVALAELSGRCLSTSGDYATTFSDDYRHHHIFDPHTGRSPQALASVSIAAATAIAADALSTAALVLGSRKGLRLVQSTPGADALFVLKDGSTLKTAGFPEVV